MEPTHHLDHGAHRCGADGRGIVVEELHYVRDHAIQFGFVREMGG
jgi:hypothetical protein